MKEFEIKHKIARAIAERQMTVKGINDATNTIYKILQEQLTLTNVSQQRELLPDANKLYKMAETIVSKQVLIFNTPENKQIDWEELKNDWFDWLNEEIKGNCA